MFCFDNDNRVEISPYPLSGKYVLLTVSPLSADNFFFIIIINLPSLQYNITSKLISWQEDPIL